MAFGLAAPALAQDKPAQEAPAAPTTYDAPIVLLTIGAS
jgi:Cu-Zn family superoxide dismutase